MSHAETRIQAVSGQRGQNRLSQVISRSRIPSARTNWAANSARTGMLEQGGPPWYGPQVRHRYDAGQVGQVQGALPQAVA